MRLRPVGVRGLWSGVTDISADLSHTCAITGAGTAKCWGSNNFGQLGDGSTTDRYLPVTVRGLASGVVAISAGGYHGCALTNIGAVKCWGVNEFGALGNGTSTNSLTPVDVSGLSSGVVAIAAGGNHTCALTNAGAVKCWGANWAGQLGDGSGTGRNTPVDVSGLSSGVVAIEASGEMGCALTSAGAVKCWGRNTYGQLGDGTTNNRSVPVAVRGLSSGVIAISAGGFHTCAVTSIGAARCWGRNEQGQLGDGTTTDRLTRVGVRGLGSGVLAIAAGASGGSHTCALIGAGAKCWGSNVAGQLGDGTTTNRLTPGWVRGFSF